MSDRQEFDQYLDQQVLIRHRIAMSGQDKLIIDLIQAICKNDNNKDLNKLVKREQEALQMELSLMLFQRQETTKQVNSILEIMSDEKMGNQHREKDISQKMGIVKTDIERWKNGFEQLQMNTGQAGIQRWKKMLLNLQQCNKGLHIFNCQIGLQNIGSCNTKQYRYLQLIQDVMQNIQVLKQKYQLKHDQCLQLIRERECYKLRYRASQINQLNQSKSYHYQPHFQQEQFNQQTSHISLSRQQSQNEKISQIVDRSEEKVSDHISQQIQLNKQFLQQFEIKWKESLRGREIQSDYKAQLLKQTKKIQQLQQQLSFYRNSSQGDINQDLQNNSTVVNQNLTNSKIQSKKSFKERQRSSVKLNNKTQINKLYDELISSEILIQKLQEEIAEVKATLNEQSRAKKELSDDNQRLRQDNKKMKISIDTLVAQKQDITSRLRIERENVEDLISTVQTMRQQRQQYLNHLQKNEVKANREWGTSVYESKLARQIHQKHQLQTRLTQSQRRLQQTKLLISQLQLSIKHKGTMISQLAQEIKQKDKSISKLAEQMSIILSKQQQVREELYKTRSMIEQMREERYENDANHKGVCLHFRSGDIFQEHEEVYREKLVDHIQNYIRRIRKTKLLYRYETLNRVNFHKYIDGHQHIVLIIKTLFGRFIAAYSEPAFLSQSQQHGRGMLMTLSDDSVYFNYPNRPPIKYDDYYLIFGNSEIRLRTLQRKIFSNFGIANAFYDSKKKKRADFLGVNDGEIEIISYEIYSLQFE